MNQGADYTEEDVGNIVSLEHLNVRVADQATATLFYIVGLGLTRDPYLTVGLENMWVNAGEQQFHLPTGKPQVARGHTGVVLPDLSALRRRLEAVAARLAGTRFNWASRNDHIEVTCPWGNRFRCYGPGPGFGDLRLGVPYIEFVVCEGAAPGIARFYREVMEAPSAVGSELGQAFARVAIGHNQWLVFRETAEVPPYDGHHIAVYVANFSRPYAFLKKHGRITEEVRGHQFRFQDIVDPDTGKVMFELEHEVRSLCHAMYHRVLVNRDPEQSQRRYTRGRDALVP